MATPPGTPSDGLPADLDDLSPEWGAVGGTPTPGVPSAATDLAGELRLRAERARALVEQWQQMGRQLSESGWEGDAAEAFLERYTELGATLVRLVESFNTAGAALLIWGDALAAGRSLSRTSLAAVLQAEEDGGERDAALGRLRVLGEEHAAEAHLAAGKISSATPAGVAFDEDLFHATLRRMGMDPDAVLGAESPDAVARSLGGVGGLDPAAAIGVVSAIAAGLRSITRTASAADGPRRLSPAATTPTANPTASPSGTPMAPHTHKLMSDDDASLRIELSLPPGWTASRTDLHTVHARCPADANTSAADLLVTIVSLRDELAENPAVLRAAMRLASSTIAQAQSSTVPGAWRDEVITNASIGDRTALVRTGRLTGTSGAAEHHHQVLVVDRDLVVIADFATPDGSDADHWDDVFTTIASGISASRT